MPVEPPPTPWQLPPPERTVAGDVVGLGADLEPGTLLAAYRQGLFPMRLDGTAGPLAWWSPDPRGVLPLDGLLVSRSLRRSVRRYTVTVDAAFDAVVAGCADPGREGRWIEESFSAAYARLHELGWAHSVETWEGDELVGGLYGVAVGGLFAGESMFSRATDASKVALVHLVGLLREDGAPRLLDVQWRTDHLATLGAVAVRRREYLRRLRVALASPLPAAFDDGRR
ncbi:leucyl/phenylalanyl-tRNA--protein transferase [Motilibacter rhizosphaerae]|uniref:Leucyl/phenylalanyl-tRNA--protein transferase n=1 Tax=Motilibacter rhizosphaerae TaxID=598652 RepID=A0A4Q7NRT7_9ACTN|nr:leucyl/phenylalanyl-tRNA--protein transferase [Motilibacter rhizosphaerae]RZS89560.1 leucyl/phenylalanyl-tRNA--protein transferase [Motilibacter rhizosphaerae]